MNKLSMLSALFVAAEMLFSNQAIAAVPPLDGKGVPAVISCPTTLAQPTAAYSDKIIFLIIGPLKAANSADQPALDNLPRQTELDIKIRDNPKTIAFLKSKVLTFLGAVVDATNAGNIQIRDVEYTAIVCPKAP
jgi:hypothetical protein